MGNRVTVFDLVKYVLRGSMFFSYPILQLSNPVVAFSNTSHTLPFAHRTNIDRLDLTPRGNILLSVDEHGRAILTNFHRRIQIYNFSFKGPVSALKFSPSGRHFAVGVGRRLQIWHTPETPTVGGDGEIDFAPFVLHRDLAGHFDEVQSIEWSSDSRFLLTASKDLTARVWSLDPEDGFEPTTLSGHRQGVRAAFFSANQEMVGLLVTTFAFRV